MYPEPEKGGRGKKALTIKEFAGGLLSQARTVLAHTPEIVDARLDQFDEPSMRSSHVGWATLPCEWPRTSCSTVRLARLGCGRGRRSGPERRDERRTAGYRCPPATTDGGGLEIGRVHLTRAAMVVRAISDHVRCGRRQARLRSLPAGVAAKADRVVSSLPSVGPINPACASGSRRPYRFRSLGTLDRRPGTCCGCA